MPPKPISEARSFLVDSLNRLWGYDSKQNTSTIVPDELRDHVENVQVDTITERIADEILENLAPDKQEIDDQPLREDPALPMIARLKPRGYHENNWLDKPTEKRPYPVILIHGTGATTGYWNSMATDLREDGYAVFAVGYGTRATGPLQESAKQVGAFVHAVLHVTGASKVILIGHSQGGLVARYWMRFHGGAEYVHHMVSLAAPNHGTSIGGIASPLIKSKLASNLMDSFVEYWFGPAGFQMVVGSPIVQALEEGGDTDEGVGYTCIATRSDSVIQPPETCFLVGENVRNVWVQDLEPNAVVLHEDMPEDKRVRRLVVAALKKASETQAVEK